MHEYTQLRMVSAYSKGSELSFSTPRAYHWTDDAACAFQPHTLFEIATSEDRIAEGIAPSGRDTRVPLRELNEENLKRAKEICNTCPVKQACIDEAEPEDFLWTVRGGRTPTNFNEEPRTNKRYGEIGPNGIRICKHCGEEQQGVKPNGGLFCRPCKYKKTNEAARLRRATGVKKPRVAAKTVKRGKTCSNGHDEWTERPSKGRASKFECYRCRRERDTIKA